MAVISATMLSNTHTVNGLAYFRQLAPTNRGYSCAQKMGPRGVTNRNPNRPRSCGNRRFKLSSKIWGFLGALLVASENTVPIFIHNAKSQQIEGVVMTQGNQLFETLAQIFASAPATSPVQTTTGTGQKTTTVTTTG